MFKAMRVSADYLAHRINLAKRDQSDEEDVQGKIVIVTGANSGIGKATTKELAKRGATVIMACRDLKRADEARRDIRTEIDTGKLIIMELDLGNLASVRRFVGEFKKQYDRIDILINNAGVSDQNGIILKTRDGFERHFGTNHLGHFLLTTLLLDLLKNSAPSRIIAVSSTLYATSNLDLDNLMMENVRSHGVGNLYPYGNSKLANLLFIKALAKKLEGTGVTTYALCPGLAATNVFRTQPKFKHFVTNVAIKLAGFSAEKGCQTTLLCALSKKLAQESGKMYRFGKEWKHVMNNLDTELATELWRNSENLVNQNLSLQLTS